MNEIMNEMKKIGTGEDSRVRCHQCCYRIARLAQYVLEKDEFEKASSSTSQSIFMLDRHTKDDPPLRPIELAH